jgi:hypothetical protein
MTDSTKVKPSHTQRGAFVYIRQSSPSQVEYNRESTARQYALVQKACELGWAKEHVLVIDEDLGLSGSGSAKRSGFARMTAEVALGHVGIVLGLEVSRLARNNADWYRLLDLCGITDTLIGDSDGRATGRRLWPFEHSRQPDEPWCSIRRATCRWLEGRFL